MHIYYNLETDWIGQVSQKIRSDAGLNDGGAGGVRVKHRQVGDNDGPLNDTHVRPAHQVHKVSFIHGITGVDDKVS